MELLIREAESGGDNSSNLIVLTSSGSFKGQVADVMGRKIKWRRVIRDELHLERRPGTKNITLMRDETYGRQRGKASAWFLSGTPFEKVSYSLSFVSPNVFNLTTSSIVRSGLGD